MSAKDKNKAEKLNVYNNTIGKKNDGKTDTTTVSYQTYKEEFYNIFFGYMTNKPSRVAVDNAFDTDHTKTKTSSSIPFSLFDRGESSPIPILYSMDGAINPDGGGAGGGNYYKNDTTFINNNRGFYSAPSGRDISKQGITGLSSSNNAKDLRLGNIAITNYLSQVPTELKTQLADSTSLSNYFNTEKESVQKQMFDVSIRNICSVFSQEGNLSNMSLIPQDFGFIKDINLKSNNKLVVLRRYPFPVGNNPLLSKDKNTKPISTLLGYLESDTWISISLGETWSDIENPDFTSLFNKSGGSSKDSNINAIKSLFGDAAFNSVLRKANLKDKNAAYNIAADPNLIVKSKYRGEGLENDLTISFKSTYQLKYYPGIDIENLFLDILANIFSMTTSDRISLFTPQDSNTIENVRNLINSQSSEKAFEDGITFLKETMLKVVSTAKVSSDNNTQTSNDKKKDILQNVKEKLGEDLYNNLTTIFSSIETVATNLTNDIIGSAFSKYELKLKGSIAALFGQENAPWHITIGNPMRPTISIGNLIMSNASVTLKGQATLADIPSEIEFSCDLKPATRLGKQDLESIFNAGLGRIYNNFTNKQPKNYTREKNPKEKVSNSNPDSNITQHNFNGGINTKK